MRLLIYLIFFMLFTPSSNAIINDFVVKQWTLQSGLPSQSINSITQDNSGYIWLGTQYGLSRFDGHQFTNFNTKNSSFLKTNAINKILLDNQGFLWIGTQKSLYKFDPQTFEATLTNIKGPVKDMLKDQRGNVWVAAEGVFYVPTSFVDVEKEGLKNNVIQGTKINQVVGSVSKMALTKDGVWFVNKHSLFKVKKSYLDNNTFKLTLSSKTLLPALLSQSIINDLAWVDGRLYIASEVGVYAVDLDGVIRSALSLEGQTVYKLMSNGEGKLWVATSKQLLFGNHYGQLEEVSPIYSDQSIRFSDIFKDKEGNIWLASLNEGLWFAHAGKVERHEVFESNSKQGFTAITEGEEGVLWVASSDGVGKRSKNGEYTLVIPSKDLGGARVNELEFYDFELLIGTEKGLLVYDNNEVRRLPYREIAKSDITSLSPSHQAGLWVGTHRGLFHLGNNGLTPFAYNSFLNSQFVKFVIDFPSFGLIGTNKGAYRFNGKGIEKLGRNTMLETSVVNSILSLDNGVILAATWNDGLFYYTKKGRWHHLDAANGLPYGSITSIHLDENKKLVWFGTERGVYRMPVDQFYSKIENVNVEQVISPFDRQLNGRTSRCCSGYGHDALVETEQSIMFPSSEGVIEIAKDVALFGQVPLMPNIEAVQTDSRRLTGSEIDDTVQLMTEERNLTITFTAIDFYAPKSVEFRYKFSHETSDNWREGSLHKAVYSNVKPGEFTFTVQVKRRGQDWKVAQEKAITIMIPRRFDETVYFRLVIASGGVFLLYLVFWVFRTQEKRKQRGLEELVEERTTELRKANEKLNQVNSQLKLVSHTDELTGLHSRRFLFDQLPKDVEHYQRNAHSLQQQDKRLVLLILNIDNFSKINDSFGPLGGDSCLQQLASLLNTRTQGSDYVARWSGDEFLLLLRDFKRDSIEAYVMNLCKAIAEFKFQLPNGNEIQMKVSIGWSFYPLPLLGGQVIGWEASVNLADIALHQVKSRGGDGAAHISFDDQLDAFEFEHSSNIDSQLQTLQANGLAEINIWMR